MTEALEKLGRSIAELQKAIDGLAKVIEGQQPDKQETDAEFLEQIKAEDARGHRPDKDGWYYFRCYWVYRVKDGADQVYASGVWIAWGIQWTRLQYVDARYDPISPAEAARITGDTSIAEAK